jgi:hypothetical protein
MCAVAAPHASQDGLKSPGRAGPSALLPLAEAGGGAADPHAESGSPISPSVSVPGIGYLQGPEPTNPRETAAAARI